MSTEHSAICVGINCCQQNECQYTRKVLTNLTQAQTPGRWGSAFCIYTFRLFTSQCVGMYLQGGRSLCGWDKSIRKTQRTWMMHLFPSSSTCVWHGRSQSNLSKACTGEQWHGWGILQTRGERTQILWFGYTFKNFISQLIEVKIFRNEEPRHKFIWLLMGNSTRKFVSIYSWMKTVS